MAEKQQKLEVVPPADELEEALRRIGIKRGTWVEVGDEELEWQ